MILLMLAKRASQSEEDARYPAPSQKDGLLGQDDLPEIVLWVSFRQKNTDRPYVLVQRCVPRHQLSMSEVLFQVAVLTFDLHT